MALATTTKKADTPTRYVQVVRSGTRTAADFSVELGFSPFKVVVTNCTDRISGEWTSELNAINATGQIKRAANGDTTYANCGISVTGRTLMVDVSTATLETDDDVVLIEAWG